MRARAKELKLLSKNRMRTFCGPIAEYCFAQNMLSHTKHNIDRGTEIQIYSSSPKRASSWLRLDKASTEEQELGYSSSNSDFTDLMKESIFSLVRPEKGDPEDLWVKSVTGGRPRLKGSVFSMSSFSKVRFSSPTVSDEVYLLWNSNNLDLRLCLWTACITLMERISVWTDKSRRAECWLAIADLQRATITYHSTCNHFLDFFWQKQSHEHQKNCSREHICLSVRGEVKYPPNPYF